MGEGSLSSTLNSPGETTRRRLAVSRRNQIRANLETNLKDK